ncbi:MAG: hypothetical protein EPN75_03585 [Beijerinckiaceae bacterium]|nr:MAG: hypothetical protein EPN75_03585 [Beijerinckiaceae bacterium]
MVVEKELNSFRLDDALPTPAEQADRLILWIASHQSLSGEWVENSIAEIDAWIGAAIASPGVTQGWLLDEEDVKKFIEAQTPVNARRKFRLTFAGWKHYETIKRAEVESRTAFMAMQFGDAELDAIVESYFKPAVQRAGFELRVLTDGQAAGLLDDQMRVRLRTSRFTIADLTHANNGAYWEAGFAEGLGRPVIYTCRKKEWNELNEHGRNKVHFDTNHMATIIWDPSNPNEAAQRLTAMIRATLPAEAKMTDRVS